MISIVTEIEAVIRSRCGIATARKNVSGSEQTSASSTCRSSPTVPATVEPEDAEHRRQPHRPRALEHHRQLVHADHRQRADARREHPLALAR